MAFKNEQADRRDSKGSRYHAYLKRAKSRYERRRARRDPGVRPTYTRHNGYET